MSGQRVSFKLAIMAILVGVALHADQAIATTQGLFNPYFLKCRKKIREKHDSDCRTEIFFLLEKGRLWADANHFYEKGKEFWQDKRPKIEFIEVKSRDAEFELRKLGDVWEPVIKLPREMDSFERIIALNHEISHYANSKAIVASLKKTPANQKINDCISNYDQTLLRDERSALLSDVYFWKDSPAWFKRRLRKIKFKSKLLPGEWTYSKYYEAIEKKLENSPKFPMDRYIEIEKLPACAKAFI